MTKNKKEWLDEALDIVDQEEELGPMPNEVLEHLALLKPEDSLRALVRATKNSIKERLIKHFS